MASSARCNTPPCIPRGEVTRGALRRLIPLPHTHATHHSWCVGPRAVGKCVCARGALGRPGPPKAPQPWMRARSSRAARSGARSELPPASAHATHSRGNVLQPLAAGHQYTPAPSACARGTRPRHVYTLNTRGRLSAQTHIARTHSMCTGGR